MWLIINIIILLIGFSLMGWGKHTDSSENIEALMFFIFGVIITVIGVISECVRWIN